MPKAQPQPPSVSLFGDALLAQLNIDHSKLAHGDEPATLARYDFGEFCTYMDPTYEDAPHTQVIRDALEKAERGEIRRLIVTMPPRHGKSRHCSEFFPAWVLGRRPNAEIVIASHTDTRAEAASREVQNLLVNPRWPWPLVRVDYHVRGVSRWQTTDGGQVLACGVSSGSATGFGADFLIIDDYHRHRQDADSALVRDSAWGFFTETGRTRMSPDGVIIILATRWHEDDMIGRILSGPGADKWTLIELRAVCDDDTDPLGREFGEVLWPTRWPREKMPSVEDNEIDMRGWEAQYQQRPTAAQGNLFHRDWWRRYDPEVLRVRGLHPAFIAVDSAFKEGVSNDFSVAAVWGKFEGQAYLIDVWRQRVQFPDLVESLKDLYQKWRVPIIIEDKASGQSALQVLARAKIPVIAHKLPPSSTKTSRAEALTLSVEAGMVFLPTEAPWVNDFIEEHAAFPSSTHDDQVDTTSMALPRLLMGWERREPREMVYNTGRARPKVRWIEQMREKRRLIAEERLKRLEEEHGIH